MSLFYDCNECKEKEYVKENGIRALNESKQQDIVDMQIAEALGLDVQASNLSRLAKRVINSIGSDLLPTNIKVVETAKQKVPVDYLLQAITTGKLTELFDKIKAIPVQKLSKKARVIQDDVKNNKDMKEVLNEGIANIINSQDIPEEEKPKAIKREITDIVAGGDEKAIEELTDYASDGSNDSKNETSIMSSWADFYLDVPELADVKATIDTAIARGKDKIIKLYSNDEKKDGGYKLLPYANNKYLELKLDNDGPQFLYEKRGGQGSKYKKSVDYNTLKQLNLLSNLNKAELIKSIVAE